MLTTCLLCPSCGGDDGGDAASADTSADGESGGDGADGFGEIGPLHTDAGKGSFRFGASSAATQIEDQNPNVDWFAWTAPPPDGLGNGEFIGDAAKGYSMALEDIDLMVQAGLDSYRFSIEWARVEPQRDMVDEAALAHYDEFIDALIEAGIRPVVTIHHFSNPIWVDDPRDVECADGPSDANLCGWNHPEGGPQVVAELAEHATLIAERFGDRVDDWATINEPINYLLAGYGTGVFPPGKSGLLADFDGVFIAAARNLVAGHVAIFDALETADTLDADDDGVPASIGFTKGAIAWVPARGNELSDDPADVAARDRVDYVYHRLFVESLRRGAFDADLDGEFEEPHPDWEGKLHYLGVQYYFRAGVTSSPGLLPNIMATPCFGDFDLGACVPMLDESYGVPAMGYEHWPMGLYERLMDFSQRYPDLPLTVTESGIATESGQRRAEVVVRALEAIEKARSEGADVRGYYHWSLTDNFEWAEGYEPRFGLFRVDYDTYARTPTAAVEVLADIVSVRDLSEEIRQEYGGEGPLSPEPAQ